MTIEYLDLADYVAIAAAVTGLDVPTLLKVTSLDLADSALHAPAAGFGDTDFYPDFIDAVPVVDLPDTLGWERPIEDPAAPLGVLAVLARGVFLLVVLKLVVALVRLSLPPRPGSP